MKTTFRFSPRSLAAGASRATLGFAAAPAAQAAATDLADQPIVTWTLPAPNLMLTLDNSGSMHWGFMPGSALDHRRDKCFLSPQYNTLFYNPQHRYLPGRKADGTSYPPSDFRAAWVNGYNHDYKWGATPKADEMSSSDFKKYGEFNKYDQSYNTAKQVDLSKDFHAMFDTMAHNHDRGHPENERWTVTPAAAAYYYAYTGPTPAGNACHGDASYTKVHIKRAEQQNFANWFTYYRTRLTTMKTVLSQAFAEINGDYRVGFTTINENPSPANNKNGPENASGANFLPVDKFVTKASGRGQKDRWFDTILNLEDSGGTPLIAAARRIAEYYAGRNPYPASGISAPDPIPKTAASCQRNYQLIATDGYWEDGASDVRNSDTTVPASLPVEGIYDPIAKRRLRRGSAFPAPFGNSNYGEDVVNMADLSMHYWVNNLRTEVPGPGDVVPTARDPATWLHMTTYSISLGEHGTLSKNTATVRKLFDGSLSWPAPSRGTETTIDDLWHAALNGHGDFVAAADSQELSAALRGMLVEMRSATFSGAAASISVPDLALGKPIELETTYDPGGWTGDLTAKKIDIETAAVEAKPMWSAQEVLENMDWRLRNIATSIPRAAGEGNTGVSFSATTLPAGLRTRLDSPASALLPGDHANVIGYLRGSRENEAKSYRSRVKILGDLIDAEPVFVGPPSQQYTDTGYAAFFEEKKGRPGMVYQGANDGMLHAFDAANGVERWAYVPGLLLQAPFVTRTDADHAGVNYPDQSPLVNLSLLDGFRHLAYVNGTPAVADVDLGNAGGAKGVPDWKTLLVGGLQKGGRGYYALDVTTPPEQKRKASDPDTAAHFVKWEFPQKGTDADTVRNIGYSYGLPVIVKTASHGWVVLVTSGYNNGSQTGGDGKGHLFVLHPNTGALIADIVTGGTPEIPSGLAQISAYSEQNNIDNTTDFVYGGDLRGNLWRFDLRKKPADWRATRLAQLVDENGKPQPITSAPELATIGKNRLVYVGTGQYLGPTDRPTEDGNVHARQTQSLYGLLDDKSSEPGITPLREKLVKQTIKTTVAGNSGSAIVSAKSVDLANYKGWYIDLPNNYERVIQRPTLEARTITFTTAIPGTDACNPFGSAWLYTLDYATGGDVADHGNGYNAHYFSSGMVSRPVPLRTKDGKYRVIVRTFGGDPGSNQDADPRTSDRASGIYQRPVGTTAVKPDGRRIFWREVITK